MKGGLEEPESVGVAGSMSRGLGAGSLRTDKTHVIKRRDETEHLTLSLGSEGESCYYPKMNHLLRKQSGSLMQVARQSKSETLSPEGGWEAQGGGTAGKHRFRTGTRTPRLEP